MAASIPRHYCSDYPTEFCTLPNDAVVCEETSNMFNNSINCNTLQQKQLPLLGYDINSPVSVASFPESFGVSPDCMLLPQMSEIETGFRDFSVHYDHYNQMPQVVFDSGEECSTGSAHPNFWPQYYTPSLAENWGIQAGKAAAAIVDETDQVKVGRYSVEERKDRILRYLKKRNQRNFNKRIKYACRKTLADKRVRIRGRFAKNNENEPPSQLQQILVNHQQNNINSFHDHSFQMMKYDDEDYNWLEAAIDNLGHFPFVDS